MDLDWVPEAIRTDLEFVAWFETRPPTIQAMVRATPPWLEYHLNDDGDIYRIHSYMEDGTVKAERYSSAPVGISPMWGVFGINPANLVPVPTRGV